MSSRAARGQPPSSPKGRRQRQQQQPQPRAELRQRRSTASSTSSSSTPPISPRTRSQTASFRTTGGTMVPQVTSEKEPTPSTSTEDSLQAVHVDGGGSSGAISGRETEDDSQSDSYAGGAALNGTLPLISANHHHPGSTTNHHYHKVAYAYDADTMKLEALEMEDKACCGGGGGGGVTSGGLAASAKPLLKRLQSSLEVPPHRGSRGNLGDDSEEQEVSTTSEDLPAPPESLWAISFQVFIPFLIAGLGTVGAGLVLDIVQHWTVFKQVTEVFILVPALLGLKGNLEMTLASRLSTQANLGHMDSAAEQIKMTTGNMALIQCQATVLGFLASVFAVVMGWIPNGEFNTNHALVLCASSLVTASLASLILGGIMVGVVIASRKCHINPDNVATPIAASLGDLTTLALLSGFSSFIFNRVETERWLAPLVICIFLVLLPVWILVARRNNYTREVLSSGWTPILAAVAISSAGGVVLDFAVSRFKGIAVYQPVINGVGGNLVAVQASRISTYLHQHSRLGVLPPSDSMICLNPLAAFCGKTPHSRTALVLLLMVVPGHIIFAYGIRLLKAGHTSLTVIFLVVYLSAALIQVFLLLITAHIMVHWMWHMRTDPDNSAIPYLTAIGDLLGTSLLALAFLLLYSVGDKDADVGD